MDVIFEVQGRRFSIEVGFYDTILEFKEKVQKYQGIPISKQTLVFNGQILPDDGDIWKCAIFQNSLIHLMVATTESDHHRLPIDQDTMVPLAVATAMVSGEGGGRASKKLKIMVLPKRGLKKVPVEMNASDNVGELRKELQKLKQRMQVHLPPEGYFFIYKQNVMDDDKSFRWHHVCQGDTIEIFNGSATGGS